MHIQNKIWRSPTSITLKIGANLEKKKMLLEERNNYFLFSCKSRLYDKEAQYTISCCLFIANMFFHRQLTHNTHTSMYTTVNR